VVTAASIPAARPRFRPESVSGASRAAPLAESEEVVDAADPKPRRGRFGGLFGSVVHRAIGLVLRNSGLAPQDAVQQAAARFGLDEHFDEAVADVGRAVEALKKEGLAGPIGTHLQVEYPIAATWEGGQLLSGYIDLVGSTEEAFRSSTLRLTHHRQVRLSRPIRSMPHRCVPTGVCSRYRHLGDRKLSCGLLFTADGGIRYTEPKVRNSCFLRPAANKPGRLGRIGRFTDLLLCATLCDNIRFMQGESGTKGTPLEPWASSKRCGSSRSRPRHDLPLD